MATVETTDKVVCGSVRVDSGILATALRGVCFAAASQGTRYVLNCVRWQWTDTTLELTATDGCYMARFTLDWPCGPAGAEWLLSARECVALADKLAAKTATRCLISWNLSTVGFCWRSAGREKYAAIQLTTDGLFPRTDDIWRGVIDRDPQYWCAVKEVIRDDCDGRVTLGDNGALIRAPHTLAIVAQNGKAPAVAFDVDRLAEWLHSLPSCEGAPRLEFAGPEDPIRGVHSGKAWRADYVLMPMRKD